jgi:hypothetical protein
MGYVLRIGYRHLESIHFQTIAVAMSVNWSKRQFDFRDWLIEQAPELIEVYDSMGEMDDIPSSFNHDRSSHYAILLNSVLFNYESRSIDNAIRFHFSQSLVSTSVSEHVEEDDAGASYGGSWDIDPFAFRSGIIMTLGTLEAFERGVVKILTGLKHNNRSYTSASDPFKPRLPEFEASNPIFEGLESKRKTFTSGSRMKILEEFGIKKSNDPWRTRLDKSWRDRNQIAHGLFPVNTTLSMYLQTHYDVLTAMRWLCDECHTAQNIIL